MFEGFLTYGGMSVREMEAITVGLEETMDEDVISQGPIFIDFMCKELMKRGVPVVTPAGGLGCHLNAREFLPHIDDHEYPAGALAAAVYLAGGVRGMERGTLSEQREPDGTEPIAEVELLRLAMPQARLHHEPGALRRGPHHVAASRTASSSAACAGSRSRAACASSSAAWSPRATGRRSWSKSSATTSATACKRRAAGKKRASHQTGALLPVNGGPGGPFRRCRAGVRSRRCRRCAGAAGRRGCWRRR